MRLTGLASAAVLTLTLSGCGTDASESGDAPQRPTCPTYSQAADPPNGDPYDEYIVKFVEGSEAASDSEARADRLGEIAASVCRDVTELREMSLPGTVLVRADKPMVGAEQEGFVAAFEAADDVAYAEPNHQVRLD